MSSSAPLLAGVARTSITPSLGIRLAGYTVQQDFATDVHSELHATAICLTDGTPGSTVVILGLDILFIQNPACDEIRQQIGARLGIEPSNVLLNFSHTHLGPMTGWYSDGGVDSVDYPPSGSYSSVPSDEWRAKSSEIWSAFGCQCNVQARYLDALRDNLTAVAAAAQRAAVPCRVGSAIGSSLVGVNRRLQLPDGRTIIGINHDGVVDRAVDLIRIDGLQGTTIATILSTAAHPIVLGPATSSVSSDYVGPARNIVEAHTNAPCLFLQGAAGNIMPNSGVGAGGPEQFEDLERIGAMLGGAALQLWAQIRTHNFLGEAQVVQSVAVISTYLYEPIKRQGLDVVPDGTPALAVRTTRLTMPLAPFPPQAVAEERLRMFERERDAALARGAPAGVNNVAQRMYTWAKAVADGAASGERAPMQEIEVWTLRLNDIAICAVSAEALTELSLEVKARAVASTGGQLRHTLFCGYSNGCLGYLPPPKCFDQGGMEVVESSWNYNLPSQVGVVNIV